MRFVLIHGGDAQVTQFMTDETGMQQFVRPDPNGRMACADFEAVRDFFYHDCDDATAKWAYARLTPAPVEFLTEVTSVPAFCQADCRAAMSAVCKTEPSRTRCRMR